MESCQYSGSSHFGCNNSNIQISIYRVNVYSIVFALGEGASYVFEQIYTGKKSLSDIEWVKQILEEKLTKSFMEKLTKALKSIPEIADKKQIMEAILKVFANKNNLHPLRHFLPPKTTKFIRFATNCIFSCVFRNDIIIMRQEM